MQTQQLFVLCRVIWILLALLSVTSRSAAAATLPPGFTESPVATGLANPTAMQFAPDGRLFVCEQGGRLRVIKNGTLLSTPFLTVTVSSVGERGLLGVAFDPDFATNHFVYVYYTATSPTIHNRISRFTESNSGDVAVAGSELVIFDLDNLSGATNHNGGALNFGPDRKLYAAVGENASGANAQSMNTVLGKLLRINTDGSIPGDNPFVATTTGKNGAIWALGLRNPFTFAFHPSQPVMFINDVGETTWEEINDGVAGANYGWPITEGMTTDPRFRSPRYAYNHSGACAITGGAFYAPLNQQFPASYAGDYFFADYCGGWIRKLHPADNSIANFASGIISPVDLKVSNDGSLYYLARGSGSATGVVYQVQVSTAAPTITTQPASQTVAPGAPVTFSVRASGTSPLRYQWRRNTADIVGATSQDYTITSVSQADNGAMFQALVSNDFGSVFSDQALLTVNANQAPTATITQPAVGTLYSGGSVINFAGTGTDPEDGSQLPQSAFTWRVDFHHDTHMHPFIPDTTGASSGSFTIPTMGETSANVWYRIYLTVRDSGGLTNTVQRDILPRVARLTLATNPAGLQLNLDGQPVATPISFDGVVGIVRTLEATTPQTSGGTAYQFSSWSDGGARVHTISTPASNTTYTAAYTVSGGGSPGVVSINFVGNGTAMGPAESAGVVPRANWNNATGATRSTPLALVNETGGASGAAVTWTSNNVWSTVITDQAGDRRMMKGYLDTSATSVTTVAVTLPAGVYDVYVYADGENGGTARTGAYAISGAGITTTTVDLTDAANASFNGTFTQANNSTGNYVKFSGVATGSGGFTLTATPGSSADMVRRAPINGVQIVPTAAPDFTLSVTPGSRTVTPGSNTSYTVSVGALNGFAGSVSLAVSGLPANTTASFTPPSVTGSGTATLNVTTAANTPAGSSTLTITGTAGSVSHTATTALIVNTAPPRGVVSINFVGNGTAMGPAESAGVVAKANWNNATGATQSAPLALVDENGGASGASVTWTSNNVWSTFIPDQAGNDRMMRGYLDTSTTSVTTIAVALPAGVYDVYVYADGENGGATRTGAYAISGTGITTTTVNLTDAGNTSFNGTFTQANNSAGNYVKFSGIAVGASGFTLTATPGSASDSLRRAPVNAVQIVPQ